MAAAPPAEATLLKPGATPVEAALLTPGVTAGKTPVDEAVLPDAKTLDGPVVGTNKVSCQKDGKMEGDS